MKRRYAACLDERQAADSRTPIFSDATKRFRQSIAALPIFVTTAQVIQPSFGQFVGAGP
jgi:hypothetical protein